MGNPPFMPPKFAPGPPTAINWEDGPGLFTNPANSTQAVRYNGQDQILHINSVYLPPPPSPTKCTWPHAAVGMSQIFNQP